MSDSSQQPVKENQARENKGFSVAASPFNGVKLELALIMVIAVVFMLMVDKVTSSDSTQYLLLLGFGLLAMIWLVVRTRMILNRQLQHKQTTVKGQDNTENHKQEAI